MSQYSPNDLFSFLSFFYEGFMDEWCCVPLVGCSTNQSQPTGTTLIFPWWLCHKLHFLPWGANVQAHTLTTGMITRRPMGKTYQNNQHSLLMTGFLHGNRDLDWSRISFRLLLRYTRPTACRQDYQHTNWHALILSLQLHIPCFRLFASFSTFLNLFRLLHVFSENNSF